MSARLEASPCLRRMRLSDIDRVAEIERATYDFPWSKGNFRDAVEAAYECWLLTFDEVTIGYGVLMLGFEEAHLLNLTIAPEWQGRGHGKWLLTHLIKLGQQKHAKVVLLEVRPSNVIGQLLYNRFGFKQIALRHNYYPAHEGREDALVLCLTL